MYLGLKGNLYETGKLLGQGGEGKVFEIEGHPNLVLKEYAPKNRTESKCRKLVSMMKSELPTRALSQITWPVDIVRQDDEFVGYVMPAVRDCEDYNIIYSGKYSFTLEQRIIIAMNLCVAISSVHEINQVCGDMNPKNIQVDPKSANIKLIDTDSFHITDRESGKIFPCEVGMGEYLAPELQVKAQQGFDIAPLPTFTRETDLFALAIHIFAILMNGCHPFACVQLTQKGQSVTNPTLVDSISRGQFVFYNPPADFTAPLYAPKFNCMPRNLQNMFIKSFVNGYLEESDRPTAQQWWNILNEIRPQADANFPEWASQKNQDFEKEIQRQRQIQEAQKLEQARVKQDEELAKRLAEEKIAKERNQKVLEQQQRLQQQQAQTNQPIPPSPTNTSTQTTGADSKDILSAVLKKSNSTTTKYFIFSMVTLVVTTIAYLMAYDNSGYFKYYFVGMLPQSYVSGLLGGIIAITFILFLIIKFVDSESLKKVSGMSDNMMLALLYSKIKRRKASSVINIVVVISVVFVFMEIANSWYALYHMCNDFTWYRILCYMSWNPIIYWFVIIFIVSFLIKLFVDNRKYMKLFEKARDEIWQK